MRKLINGIVRFRKEMMPAYRESFAKLALGQKPDALFLACSDSRVVPNLFASADPGDLFVLRHMGNFVPPPEAGDLAGSAAAAIEFAVKNLKVKDIIVCGHSNCGAIASLLNPEPMEKSLKSWIELARPAIGFLESRPDLGAAWPHADRLSQANALLQISNLERYPTVKKAVDKGDLNLHAWWFDLAAADVYSYSSAKKQFEIIDEKISVQP